MHFKLQIKCLKPAELIAVHATNPKLCSHVGERNCIMKSEIMISSYGWCKYAHELCAIRVAQRQFWPQPSIKPIRVFWHIARFSVSYSCQFQRMLGKAKQRVVYFMRCVSFRRIICLHLIITRCAHKSSVVLCIYCELFVILKWKYAAIWLACIYC